MWPKLPGGWNHPVGSSGTAGCPCRVPGWRRCGIPVPLPEPPACTRVWCHLVVPAHTGDTARSCQRRAGTGGHRGDPGAQRSAALAASVPCASARAARTVRAALPAPALSLCPPFQNNPVRITHDPKGSALCFPCAGAKGEEAATAHGMWDRHLGMEPSIRCEGAPEHGTVSRLPVTNSSVYFDENFSPPGTEIIC